MDKKGLYFVALICFCFQRSWASSERFYMEDECGQLIDMEERNLESIRVEMTKYQLYHNALDCVFRVKAPQNKRFEVKILKNNIERSENCNKDFLQIYDGPELINDVLPDLDRRVCSSSSLRRSYASTGDVITVRFKSDQTEALDGFRLLITAFRTDPDDECFSNEFQCKSTKRCISDDLVCDRFEDCSDSSDECALSTPAIIGIAVGGVVALLLIVGILICVCCLRNKRVRTGSTKRLNQHDQSGSDGAGTPTTEEPEITDIHYYRPRSYHQQVHTVPSNYSAYTVNGPYYTYNKPEGIDNTRHVWITAQPEVTYIPTYN